MGVFYFMKKGSEMEKKNIKVTCYGKEETWTDRTKAIAFYEKAKSYSEGNEKARYENILLQLRSGSTNCTDE